MSVYTRPDSPFFWTEFRIEGVRFRISTDVTSEPKNRRKADLQAEKLKEERRAALQKEKAERATWEGKPAPTLGYVAARYWEEVGKFHVASQQTWDSLEWLIDHFGSNTLLPEIDGDKISVMVARRRAIRLERDRETKRLTEIPCETVANATVNRYATEPLRKLMRRAREVWGYRLQYPEWKKLLLPEPKERVREATLAEEDAIETALGEDYGRLFRFMMATGLRARAALLTWPQLDLGAGIARVPNKRRDGQERWYVVPLSKTAIAVLQECQGQHETQVFTYTAKRTVHQQGDSKAKRVKIEKGKRYPITENGFKAEWRRCVREEGLAPGFRRHDTRHTLGTRVLRATGNLKAVQKLLGHARIETTTRYAHVVIDDLRAGLEASEQATAAAKRKAGTKKDQSVGGFVGTSVRKKGL